MAEYTDLILNPLNKRVGLFLARYVTPIRTLKKNLSTEHSGTGLLLSSGNDRVYCLTADHVLSPINRNPSSNMEVNCHMHSTIKEMNNDSNTYMLRRRFYRNDITDIALAESCISETGLQDHLDLQFAPINNFIEGEDMKVFDDDTFIMSGYPTSLVLENTAIRHTEYGLHSFFFWGKSIYTDSSSSPFYEFGKGLIDAPHGMSGSPIWLIRIKERPNSPITPELLDPANIGELNFSLIFFGIVTNFNSTSERFVAIKPKICRMFVAQHINIWGQSKNSSSTLFFSLGFGPLL